MLKGIKSLKGKRTLTLKVSTLFIAPWAERSCFLSFPLEEEMKIQERFSRFFSPKKKNGKKNNPGHLCQVKDVMQGPSSLYITFAITGNSKWTSLDSSSSEGCFLLLPLKHRPADRRQDCQCGLLFQWQRQHQKIQRVTGQLSFGNWMSFWVLESKFRF